MLTTIVILLVTLLAPTSLWAQGESWSPQAPIPDYDMLTERPPFLVTDQAHRVHAFNSQTVDDSQRLIMYRQWSVEEGWSQPNDIFASNVNNIELLGLFKDQDDVVHLVMHIGNHIYYSHAPLVQAGLASAWPTPLLVGERAQYPLGASIVGDSQGSLAILYAGTADGNGLYGVTSTDHGESWSTPQPLLLTDESHIVVAGMNLVTDRSGVIHFVWNEFDQKGTGVAAYYASSPLHQMHLSSLQELDEGGLGLGIKFATIVEYQDDLIVTYYTGRTNGHYWRRSNDGGQTWTEPVRVTPDHVGTNGPVSYAVDSNNVLHLFFGQRLDENNHGVWHLVWTGNGWANLEAIVRGPQIVDVAGGKGFDPNTANGVVVNGNLLFVAWATDGVAGVNGAWYSYKFIDTPQLPTKELAIVPPMQHVTPIPATPLDVVAVPTPVQTAQALASFAGRNSSEILSSSQILFASLVPSIVVVGAAILFAASISKRL